MTDFHDARFHRHYDIVPSGCWVWNRATFLFSVDRTRVPVTHHAYEREYGPIPPGKRVFQVCLNRCCVNPAHLRLCDGEYLTSAQKNKLSAKARMRYRFEQKYHIDPSGCWLWHGARNQCGNGIFATHDGNCRAAHHLSFELANRVKLPKHTRVFQTCGNPNCVNPEHLTLTPPVQGNRVPSTQARRRAEKMLNWLYVHLDAVTPALDQIEQYLDSFKKSKQEHHV